MIITLSGRFLDTPLTLLRRCGYAPYRSRDGSESFIKRLRGTLYPRFHLYVHAADAERLAFNLHLDAKQPSYEGSRAHGGEYDGEVVEEEAARIRDTLGNQNVR